jgi:hypothetical protein
MKTNNTIKANLKFILAFVAILGLTFIGSSSFAIAANLNPPINVVAVGPTTATLNSEILYDIDLTNITDPMLPPASYSNLEFKITTPAGAFLTWTEIQGYSTIPCVNAGTIATCKSTDGNFQGGHMIAKMWLTDSFDYSMDSSLCITIGAKAPKCKKLNSPKIQNLNKQSNLKLKIMKPAPFVMDAENFFNFKIANISEFKNFTGNFTFVTDAPMGTSITWVDSDSRLNCTWTMTKLTCVTKTPQNVGTDTTYYIKMKYWLPTGEMAPISVTAYISTDSLQENPNGNTDSYPVLTPNPEMQY